MATRDGMDSAAKRCQSCLILLAEARQTTLTEAAKELYVRQLKSYDSRDVEKAIQEMATEPRGSFQSAFPDLGTIIQRVIQVRESRTNKGKHQSCGHCFSGYLIFNEDGTPHHRVRDHGKDTYAKECRCLVEWRGTDRKAVAAGVE